MRPRNLLAIIHGLALIATVCSPPDALAATAPTETKGTSFAHTWRNVVFNTTQKTAIGVAYIQAKLDLRAHFFVLVGEPVIYCTGRWKLVSVSWQNAWGSGNVGRVYSFTEANAPPAVWRGVELSSANIAFPVREKPGLRLSMACDPGVFYGNGSEQASFNVPGSPSWDRTILRSTSGDWDKPYNYMSAADVKQRLRDDSLDFWESDGYGFSGTWDLVPLKLEYNLGSVIDHVRALDAEAQKAAERERSTGREGQDPLDRMFAGVETRQAQQRQEQAQLESRNDTARASAARRALADRAKALRCQAQETSPTSSLDQAANAAVQEWQACRDTKLAAFEDKTKNPRRWGFKGPDGNVRIEARFAAAKDFSEGLGLVRDAQTNRFGFVSPEGRLTIEPQYTAAEPFSGGVAAVRMGDMWGYIDRSGVMAIPARFERARSFSEGFGAVYVKDRGWGFVDRTGREVISAQFTNVGDMKGGRAEVEGRVTSVEGACDKRRVTLPVGVISSNGSWIEPLHEITRGAWQLCLTRSSN